MIIAWSECQIVLGSATAIKLDGEDADDGHQGRVHDRDVNKDRKHLDKQDRSLAPDSRAVPDQPVDLDVTESERAR